MKWEVFLKRKACIDDAQSARKKVAYVTCRECAASQGDSPSAA